MFILSIYIKRYFMNFNWSRTKEVKLLFSKDLKNEQFLRKSEIIDLWDNYLSVFDDNKCLSSQKITEHPLLKFKKEKAVTYVPDSSIIIEFANTDFSLEGITRFAEKYGRLGTGHSFENPDSYVELANAWLWELANVRNVLSLITHKQNLNIDKFSKLLKFDLGTGLWEFENNRCKTSDLNFPIYIFPNDNFEITYEKDLIRFKKNLNKDNLHQIIDDILSVIFFSFYRDRVKPVISNKENKFTSEAQPVSLIGFIWHELFKIVENNNTIKNCRYCKDVFVIGPGSARSDKIYCSNSCVVNGSRTDAIFKRYKNNFEKKGFTIRQSQGTSEKPFDYWLISKDDKLIAGLDIVQSEVSEDSQKWSNQCKTIESKLDAHNLRFAFLINKIDKKYMFIKTQSFSASPMNTIPEISQFEKILEQLGAYKKLENDHLKLKEKFVAKAQFFKDALKEEDIAVLTFDDDKNKQEVA